MTDPRTPHADCCGSPWTFHLAGCPETEQTFYTEPDNSRYLAERIANLAARPMPTEATR